MTTPPEPDARPGWTYETASDIWTYEDGLVRLIVRRHAGGFVGYGQGYGGVHLNVDLCETVEEAQRTLEENLVSDRTDPND
jgi:hypothetical protein